MRRRFCIISALLLCLSVWADKSYTLVLDPGHGGKDAGAVGKISMEKDLNLKLALKVGELINAQYPDVNVVYTRSTDVFIPLQTRADIANKNNADLFISIHANSAESKAAHGVETFILGTDKMEKNLDVAMRENAVMKLEADYKTTYQGFDPNSIDSYIMFELMQNSYMDQSLRFATLVQNRFVGNLNRGDRGVRQAAFWVLLKTACPSILFEMGFISNPDEEKFLNKKGTLDQMAQALVDAFGAYTHKEKAKEQAKEEPLSQPAEPAPQAVETPAAPETTEVPVVPQEAYAVQICASRTPLAPNDPKLKGQQCGFIQAGEWYKYYIGPFPSKEEAQTKQAELKSLFPDCWVIKLNN
ncbi:MAG: N-acetylmuramoyl-L-alanine amidase [Paludibacteraceae bacterium]|nr:N-acetylmuramoyl-L-alanine amidase [Paludibacteraceae bacterium]